MTVTPTPSITALPAAPQRLSDSRETFVVKADAFSGALPTFGTQLSAVGAAAEANATAAETAASSAEGSATSASLAATSAVTATGYAGSSTTSVAMGTGSKSLTTQTGKSFLANDQIVLIRRGDSSTRLRGTVTSYTSGTGALVMNVTASEGSGGPYTDWLVLSTAFETDSPAALAARTTAYEAKAIAFAVAL